MRLRNRTSRALFKKALTSWYFIKTFQCPEKKIADASLLLSYKLSQPAPIFRLRNNLALNEIMYCEGKLGKLNGKTANAFYLILKSIDSYPLLMVWASFMIVAERSIKYLINSTFFWPGCGASSDLCYIDLWYGTPVGKNLSVWSQSENRDYRLRYEHRWRSGLVSKWEIGDSPSYKLFGVSVKNISKPNPIKTCAYLAAVLV